MHRQYAFYCFIMHYLKIKTSCKSTSLQDVAFNCVIFSGKEGLLAHFVRS